MDGSSEEVFIDSEVGKLEKVLVHSPGLEIEVMTPKTAERVLYNDIIPYSVVAEEHRVLKKVLSLFCSVFEIRDFLLDVLLREEVRVHFVETVAERFSIEHRKEELLNLEAEQLVRVLVGGLPEKKESLTSFLSDREFDLNPLPNLYFTRDSAMVFRNGVITGAMAHNVRRLEAMIMKCIVSHHTELKKGTLLFDGSIVSDSGVTLEGGDFLVVSPGVLLMGISERTTTGAVDVLADRLCSYTGVPLDMIAVVLPHERATIHLDMIFTLIDKNQALVYEPYILGNEKLPVISMHVDPLGKKTLKREGHLLEALETAGCPVEPVLCGGGDIRRQQREQWMSGTNVLCVEPGTIIGYDCNVSTFEALGKKGYTIRNARDFLSGDDSVDQYQKLAIGIPGVELARGGGGVRCMTMPFLRESIR